jgi:CRP/FNR family transcriptional regulator
MVAHTGETAPSQLVHFLLRVPFFRDLTRSQLAEIASWFREDTFMPDEFIFHEGDPAQRFWVVQDGEVKIAKYTPGGKEVVIEVIPAGETFGGASMLLTHQPATALALSHASTLSISVDLYREILQRYPAVGVRVIEALGERMLGVIRMRALASERVERRIAHILLKMAEKCGGDTEEGCLLGVSLTRQDVAELADTTLETTIRTMSRFSKSGWVRTLRGGYILLREKAALQALAAGESDPEVR